MDRLRQIRFKLTALWHRRTLDTEMAEEMRAHLDRLMASNRAQGMTADEARYRALREFGNLPRHWRHVSKSPFNRAGHR